MTAAEPGRSDPLAVRHGEPLAERELPRAAVVIPTLNGRKRLGPCLDALSAAHYPRERLEVVVVDNASRDGTAAWLARRHPEVRVVVNRRNEGFAPASNQGARAAHEPEVLVFLNDDVRVEADWLRELVAPIVRGECASASGKMLSWDGKRIDHAGGGSNFHGIAIARGYGDPPGPEHELPRRSLFACGGAMAVDSAAFRALGGFDEEFFAYYEDLDLGWRLWIAGHEVHYAPRAVCYHHHSSTSRRFPTEMIRVLQVRNPLLCCFKNYGDANLRSILPALFALCLRRMWVMARMGGATSFRIQELAGPPKARWRRLVARLRGGHGSTRIGRLAAADLVAVNDLLGQLEHWVGRRREVQATRRRPDEEIFRLFLKPFWCVEGEPAYIALQRTLEHFLSIDELFAGASVDGPDPRK